MMSVWRLVVFVQDREEGGLEALRVTNKVLFLDTSDRVLELTLRTLSPAKTGCYKIRSRR